MSSFHRNVIDPRAVYLAQNFCCVSQCYDRSVSLRHAWRKHHGHIKT